MRPRVLLPFFAVLLGVLALMLARATPPGPHSVDVTFVREMSQHHLQAVDMATRIRDRTRDETLRVLALDIMLSQQGQVGEMRGWLSIWGIPWGGPGMTGEHARQMGMATPEEIKAISELPVAQAEREFLRLMIRHHQGAIRMIEPVLRARVRPQVRVLATHMRDAQAAEITFMTRLLRERGGTPLPPPGGTGTDDHTPGHHGAP